MLTAAFARYLDAQSLVVFDRDGADCFVETLPAEPVDAVGLWSRPGPHADLTELSRSGLQAVVRSTPDTGRARAGYTRCVALRDALHGLRHVTLAPGTEDEARLISCIARTDEPVNLGDDTNGRPRWSITFDLQTVHATPLTIA